MRFHTLLTSTLALSFSAAFALAQPIPAAPKAPGNPPAAAPVAGVPGGAPVSANAAAPASFAPLVEHLSPAVVNISSSQKENTGGPKGLPFNAPGREKELRDFLERFGGMEEDEGAPGEENDDGEGEAPFGEVQSLGSGFVIDPSGLIVTNNHVIENAEEITVNFQDDSKLVAKVVGRDAKTDLALLKVEAKKPLPSVTFGDSDTARVGDWVLAIGNPYGLGGTVTAGIISARARNINAGPFDDFLQTDAAINRGNSGGPMFNLNGEVIGISTAIFSPTGGSIGIGFAVPSDLARPVIDQLRQFGRTHRGWLGVKIQTVTPEIADSVGLKEAHGALVLEVTKDSPSAKADIKEGDVILRFNGKEVKEMRNLPRLVAESKIGTDAEVTLWRGGKEKTVTVPLGEMDEADEDGKSKPGKTDSVAPKGEKFLGMSLKPLDGKLAEQMGVATKERGVLVVAVDPGSVAAKRGLRKGDVILGVNQEDVVSVEQLRGAVDEAKKAGRDYALARVARGKTETFVPLPTSPKANK